MAAQPVPRMQLDSQLLLSSRGLSGEMPSQPAWPSAIMSAENLEIKPHSAKEAGPDVFERLYGDAVTRIRRNIDLREGSCCPSTSQVWQAVPDSLPNDGVPQAEMAAFVQDALHEYLSRRHVEGPPPSAAEVQRVLREACVERLGELDALGASGHGMPEFREGLYRFIEALDTNVPPLHVSLCAINPRPARSRVLESGAPARRIGGGWATDNQWGQCGPSATEVAEQRTLAADALQKSAERLQLFVKDPSACLYVERLKQERARNNLYFAVDGIEVQVRVEKILARRPWLENPSHPLNHWLGLCRLALEMGEVKEASDHIHRMETAIHLDEQTLQAAYAKFDHDASGSMEVSEFRQFAVYVGFGAEAVDALMQTMNVGSDGSISLAEFSEFVGRMGGTHALFEQRRQKLEATGDHYAMEPGSRVRTHFYSKGRKSRWVWDARVLGFASDGKQVDVMLDMGKFHLKQTVPRDWVVEDTDVVEALKEIGIRDDAQHYWTLILPDSEQQVVKTLTFCQRAAIDHVRTMAADNHSKALPRLMDRARSIGLSQEELWHTLTWIRDSAPIIVHVMLDRVGKFLETDTHYRNQFETNTSSGTLSHSIRMAWEKSLFGESYTKASGFERPKYGVLDVMNDFRGVLCAQHYGDSYLVLKTSRLRCTFAPGDSGGICGSQLAVLDQYAHVLLEYSDMELREVARVASAPEGSEDRIGDSTHLDSYNYKEAQIHGEIDLKKHVLRLVANERHKAPGAEYGLYQTQALCRKHGWELVWMDEERERRIHEELRSQAPRPFKVNWGTGQLDSEAGMEEPDSGDSPAQPQDCAAASPKNAGAALQARHGVARAATIPVAPTVVQTPQGPARHSFARAGTAAGRLQHSWSNSSSVLDRAGSRGVGALGPAERGCLWEEIGYEVGYHATASQRPPLQ